LQPYDQKYLDEKKIKHMSFHAYVKKMNVASRKAEGAGMISLLVPCGLPHISVAEKLSALLEEPSLKVAEHCDSGHAPYPKAMCAKCQPSALVLQQQVCCTLIHPAHWHSKGFPNGGSRRV
jgi:nuclear protein localization family protein 4